MPHSTNNLEPPKYYMDLQSQYDPESFQIELFIDYKPTRRRKLSKQVTRYYSCDYIDCHKAYGTVSHLNTHRRHKDHGPPLLKKDLEYHLNKFECF